MVRKAKAPKQKPQVIAPKSWTGYPANKPSKNPMEALGKAAGGGKSAPQG